MKIPSCDVLIVGAGPSGLMMACQLQLHHVSFQIIDHHSKENKGSGAMILQARSLEILHELSLADKAMEKAILIEEINFVFDSKASLSLPLKNVAGYASRFPYFILLEQFETEHLLESYISDAGNHVIRNTRLKSFRMGEHQVISELEGADGKLVRCQSSYIIGADGIHSKVRDLLHISFHGSSYAHPIFISDCTMQTNLAKASISFLFSDEGVYGFFPLKHRKWRIDGSFSGNKEQALAFKFDDIKDLFREVKKANIELEEAGWFSVAYCHQRNAEKIQVHRSFLIGDAAHINTPIGAQGMNTGLQDAYNLAWKLAFVIQKKANPTILDSFSDERMGITKRFARYADLVFRFMSSRRRWIVFFRTHLLSTFLKIFISRWENLMSLQMAFLHSMSQLNIHYQNSPLSISGKEDFTSNNNLKAGDRFPFYAFTKQGIATNTHALLEVASFHLFVFAPDCPLVFTDLSEQFEIKIKLIPRGVETEMLYQKLGIKQHAYFLIRPDKYISILSSDLNPHRLNQFVRAYAQV